MISNALPNAGHSTLPLEPRALSSDWRYRVCSISMRRYLPRIRTCFGVVLLLALNLSILTGPLEAKCQSNPSFKVDTATPEETVAHASGEFEVATIRSTPKGYDRWKLQFTLDGFSARGVELRQVIQEAYGVYDDDLLLGGPKWLTTDLFDIEAKVDVSEQPNFRDLSLEQRRGMLQKLLADRFKLSMHQEIRTIDVYGMEVAKGGPKFRATSMNEVHVDDIKGMNGYVTVSRPGRLEISAISMAGFAGMLNREVSRLVQDNTGLTGRYDLKLHWLPEAERSSSVPNGSVDGSSGANNSGPDQGADPSIFTALQEQLGLKLVYEKSPVTVIVIDDVDHPSPN